MSDMSVDVIMSAIGAAVSAGAATGATEAGKKAIVDAYDGLKSLIKNRFGSNSEAAVALDKLEAKPDSEGRKQMLSEELESAGAASDPELVSAARTLTALIHALPTGEKHIQIAHGRGIAQADRGSTATVNWSTGPSKDD
jgi:hypothetical protein